jgi:hypothetical protein
VQELEVVLYDASDEVLKELFVPGAVAVESVLQQLFGIQVVLV